MSVLQRQTQTATYWTDEFRIGAADIEYLFSVFLEEEQPLTNRELALRVIKHRIQLEEDKLRRLVERGQIFQPQNEYSVGTELIFPAFDYAMGKVIDDRAGQNPEYGDFRVIQVQFEDHKQREFAASLKMAHRLNFASGGALAREEGHLSADDIFGRYGERVIEEIEARLVDERDAIYLRVAGSCNRCFSTSMSDRSTLLKPSSISMAEVH